MLKLHFQHICWYKINSDVFCTFTGDIVFEGEHFLEQNKNCGYACCKFFFMVLYFFLIKITAGSKKRNLYFAKLFESC